MYPDAYGVVEMDLYRSAVLQPVSFELFDNCKTVLMLSSDAPTKAFLNWIENSKKTLILLGPLHHGKNSNWRPLPDEVVKEGIEAILNPDMHPMLIMCSYGVQETGALIGCLRKLQGWNFNSIVLEYRSFAGSKARYIVEQFIELFDTDLIAVPKKIPRWFERCLAAS